MRRSLSATCLLLIATAAVSYAILSRPEPPNNLAIESVGTPGTTLPGEVTLLAPSQSDSVALASFIGTAEAAPALPSAIEITGDTTPSFPAAPTGLTVGITGDIGDPVVALTSPEAGFVGGSVVWTATCTDDGTVDSVQLVANNTPVCDPDTVSPYGDTCDLETALTLTVDTALTLEARCCDTLANCADSTGVAVTVDITDPQVVLEEPQTGFYATSIPWVVDAQDPDGSGIASVQLILDDVNEGSPDTIVPYSGSIDISLESDATAIVFKANVCDNVGNCLDTGTATVTVDNSPPTGVAITAPADLSTHTIGDVIEIAATATDTESAITNVTCYYNTTTLISIDGSSPYTCEWNTAGLTADDYTLHVVAENGAGETTASAAITVTLEAGAATLPSGLLAHYRFESADRTADETGTYPATAVGSPTYSAGQVGDAANLGGAGNHFTVATNIPLANSSYTIAAWAKRTDSTLSDPIFTQGSGATGQGLQIGYTSSDDLLLSHWGSGNDLDTIAKFTDFGNWHHIIGTYDVATNLMTLYEDNVFVEDLTAANDYSGSGTTAIGARLFGATQRFLGSIDEVMVFDHVLDATERAQVFAYDGTGGDPPPPPSGDYYVSKTGTATTCAGAQGGGTAAMSTIAAGIGCLSAGETLIIENGSYPEIIGNTAIPSGISPTTRTTIRAQNRLGVTINPSGTSHIFQVSGSYILIDGLVIDGSNLGATDRATFLQNGPSQYVTLQFSEIRNVADTCVNFAQGASNILLANNSIHGCQHPTFQSHAVYFGASDSIIENNTIFDVRNNGIQVYNSPGNPIDNVIIRNNSIQDAPDSGLLLGSSFTNGLVYNNLIFLTNAGITYSGSNRGHKIYNNSFFDMGTYACIRKPQQVSFSGGEAALIKNNIFRLCGSSGLSVQPNTGNFTTDPSYIDITGPVYDFKLQSGSAACDGAADFSTDFTIDINGVTRPTSGTWAFGAHEQNCP